MHLRRRKQNETRKQDRRARSITRSWNNFRNTYIFTEIQVSIKIEAMTMKQQKTSYKVGALVAAEKWNTILDVSSHLKTFYLY